MTIATLDQSRSLRLKTLTTETHEALDSSIMAAAAFDSVEGYAGFAEVQYLFHRDIDALYDNPDLKTLIPDLELRSRLLLIEADLADLGRSLPRVHEAPVFSAQGVDVPTALGWLYVAEGSNMGAALLRKAVAKLGLSDEHGGRHLAPAPGGPAAHWRTFTAALDALDLTPAEDVRVIAGAKTAFARVQSLADSRLG
ncbi:biliverdin-producing heme oxygenase [Sphingomonas sp. H39-1-10]|uniref:biliverdin-producing heme oxygenase n=1 Tax=Sphingomonas pollutisoli TaxID=3030829 RepID=UPI0023B9F66A|nr:biliverdin-producing heme oxygenase [Sphingomonas pollutisoli]MDF0490294.1 biliverdin-producing heme oxygenase [Sphingomonas pollutisoli]